MSVRQRIINVREHPVVEAFIASPLGQRLTAGDRAHSTRAVTHLAPCLAAAIHELRIAGRIRVGIAWDLSENASFRFARRIAAPFVMRSFGIQTIDTVEGHAVFSHGGKDPSETNPLLANVTSIRFKQHRTMAEAITRAMTNTSLCVVNDWDLVVALHDKSARAALIEGARSTPVLCLVHGMCLTGGIVLKALGADASVRLEWTEPDGKGSFGCVGLMWEAGKLGEGGYWEGLNDLIARRLADPMFGDMRSSRDRGGAPVLLVGDEAITIGDWTLAAGMDSDVILADVPISEAFATDVGRWGEASVEACAWWLKREAERVAKPLLRDELGIVLPPLERARMEAGVSAMRLLLEDPAAYYRSRRRGGGLRGDKDGRTPLHWAAIAGDAGMVRLIAMEGCSNAELDNFGWSPAAYAATLEHFEAVDALLSLDGEDPSILPGGIAVMEIVDALCERLGLSPWGFDEIADDAADEDWEEDSTEAQETLQAAMGGLRSLAREGMPDINPVASPQVMAAALGTAPLAAASIVFIEQQEPRDGTGVQDATAAAGEPVSIGAIPGAALPADAAPTDGETEAATAEASWLPLSVREPEAIYATGSSAVPERQPDAPSEPVGAFTPIMSWVAELKAPNALTEAISRVRDWLSGAGVPVEESDGLQGESAAGSVIGDTSHQGDLLAVRHDDRRTEGCIFRTEIVIAAVEARTFASLRLGVIRSRGGPDVVPTIPRLVRSLVELEAVDAGWPMGRLLTARDHADGEKVVEHLVSDSRNQPLVVLKAGRHAGAERTLPPQLLVGATCVMLEGDAVLAFDASGHGRELPVGGMQVFPPKDGGGSDGLSGAVIRSPWRMTKHELISTAARTLSEMTRGRLSSDEGVPSYLSARRIIAERRMKALAKEARTKGRDGTVELGTVQEEVRLLQQLLVEADTEREALIVRHRDQTEALVERNQALERQVRMLQASIARFREETGGEGDYPESFEAIEEWAAETFPANVILTPRAVKEAMAAKSDAKTVRKAYECLEVLAGEYADTLAGVTGAREALNERLREIGVTIGPVGLAVDHPRYCGEYQVRHDGRIVSLDMHLQGSSSRKLEKGLRIYFTWIKEKGILVIGSLPNHLRNTLT